MPSDSPTKSYMDYAAFDVTGLLANYSAFDVDIFNGPISSLAGETFTLTRNVVTDGTYLIDTFTVNSGTDVVTTASAHGLHAGQQVKFTTTGSLPGGLTTAGTYYVSASGLTSTAFKLQTIVGSYPDSLVVTDVDLSAGAGSGTHSAHRGKTNFSILFDAEMNQGIYHAVLRFYSHAGKFSSQQYDLPVDCIVGNFVYDIADFLGPIHQDAQLRDIRVELRTGEVGGYYFDGSAGLRLPLGGTPKLYLFFHDSARTYVDDASDIRLLVFARDNFDAPPLFDFTVTDPAEQFGNEADAANPYSDVFGYPAPLRLDSAELRALIATLNAGAAGNSVTREITLSAQLRYTRAGEAQRSRPFLITVFQ